MAIKSNIFFIILLFLISMEVGAKDIYVSSTGNDNAAGTMNDPVKTLGKAFLLVENDASGSTIYLREGIYDVSSTITLNSKHSGSEGNPLIITAYQNEKVVVNGGTIIPSSKFRVLTNETRLGRVPAAARGNVYYAQLPESNYNSLFPKKDTYNASALISWNGYVLNQAQFPNRGYAYIKEIVDEGPATRFLAPGVDPPAYSESNPSGAKFYIRENIDWNMMQAEFDRTHDMKIRGYYSNDWYFEDERMGDIAADGLLQLLRYTRYGVNGSQQLPRRVNIYGALCQLDEPGEWYYDLGESLFYIWPVNEISDDNPIIIAGSGKLIECTDRLENVEFRNLIFENYSDHGIRFTNAYNIKVLGCEFRSSNGIGVRLHGAGNTIKSCNFHDSKQAFVISGNGNANILSLTNENNEAVNNHIHHLWHRGYGAFAIGGVGARFANNLIHDMNGALAYGANDCIVEFNEFYNMGYEMGDWNPMYRGADFTSLGNEIRYNFIHHLMETPYGYPIAAARNDDGGQGMNFHHNILYKSGRAAVMFQGPSNSASDNVVMETGILWWTNQVPYEKLDKSLWDSKGDYMQKLYQEALDIKEKVAAGSLSANDKSNYLGRAESVFGIEGWKNNQIWINHYPILKTLYNFDNPDQNPWMQCYDTLTNNYMNKPSSFPIHVHGPNTISNISDAREWLPNTALLDLPITFNPSEEFIDPEKFDFRFKSGATTIKGFETFDFDTIGLFLDEYRQTMPNKQQYRVTVKEKYDGISSSGGKFDYDGLNKRYSDPEYLSLATTGSRSAMQKSSALFDVSYGSETLTIKLKKQLNQPFLEIFSITGEKMIGTANAVFPYKLSSNSVGIGVYLVRIFDGKEVQTEKIVIQ